TGFLATPYLLSVLADNGRADVAYRILEQTSYPSWGYELGLGATTAWEQWDGLRPNGSITDDSVSFNHVPLVAIGDFLYRTVGGLAPDPEVPGYQHVLVRPEPGGSVASASTAVDSSYGTVSVTWSVSAGV